MPIYTFECLSCNIRFEKYFKNTGLSLSQTCPECTSPRIKKVPSLIGFRRDHTIKGNPEDGAIWDGKDYIKDED